jgi:ferredoxin-NADP reductase
MDVPRHLGHHEAAAELPLVTDSATVTDVTAMDENRTTAVESRIRELLAQHDCADVLDAARDGAAIDWAAVEDRIADVDLPAHDRDALADLRARHERPYPSLLRVRVRLADDTEFAFAPGQYATVTFDGHPRPYSIASAPTADDLEFCIRRVPGGRLTSDIFQHLDVGDEVTIRGPNGELVLGDPSPNDLVFLATGTGVAPFKSMIDYVYETDRHVVDGEERDVWLFLGAAWADDLPYRAAFRALEAEQANFHFVPTVTREHHLTDWNGESDYVQHVLLTHVADDAVDPGELPGDLRAFLGEDPVGDVDARIDPDGVDVYACGVTAMVESLLRATRALGVPDDRTTYEGFG